MTSFCRKHFIPVPVNKICYYTKENSKSCIAFCVEAKFSLLTDHDKIMFAEEQSLFTDQTPEILGNLSGYVYVSYSMKLPS